MPTTFPDYERILQPATQGTSVMLSRTGLLSALEDFEGDDPIVVSTSSTELSITRADQRRQISASCDGHDQEVALNPTFVADAVRKAVGAEVVIEIEDPLRAVIFRSADEGTYTSLVMPIQLE